MTSRVRLFLDGFFHLPYRDRKWVVEDSDTPLQHSDPPFFFALLQHGESTEDGGFKPLYVHPYRFEGAGGIFLPICDGKIGLQSRFRMQTRSMVEYLQKFPHDVPALVGLLGRESFEVPRGYGDLGQNGAQTSVREAAEETGSRILTVRDLGEACDNTGQSAHLVTVRCGILGEQIASADPDPHVRVLPRVEYFGMAGLAHLRKEGLLYCGLTLSAIAAYQICSASDPAQYPPLL